MRSYFHNDVFVAQLTVLTILSHLKRRNLCLRRLKRKRVVDMDEDGLPIVGSGVDLTKVSLTLQHQLLLT